jgi:hypothetical protein
VNPIRGLVCLPTDCSDLGGIEWSEVPATFAATPKPKRSFKDFEHTVAAVELPAPVQFKSLADSLNDLLFAVRSFRKRPINSLAAALSGK